MLLHLSVRGRPCADELGAGGNETKMKRNSTGALILVSAVVASVLVFAGCASTPTSSLTAHDLRNAEYQCEWTHPGTVELRDGFFWDRLTPRSPVELRVTMAYHAVGPLTREEVYDAAVVLLLRPGRRRSTYRYLALMINRDGKPHNTSTVLLGDRLRVKDLSVRDGQIWVEVLPLERPIPSKPGRPEEWWVFEVENDQLIRVQ